MVLVKGGSERARWGTREARTDARAWRRKAEGQAKLGGVVVRSGVYAVWPTTVLIRLNCFPAPLGHGAFPNAWRMERATSSVTPPSSHSVNDQSLCPPPGAST